MTVTSKALLGSLDLHSFFSIHLFQIAISWQFCPIPPSQGPQYCLALNGTCFYFALEQGKRFWQHLSGAGPNADALGATYIPYGIFTTHSASAGAECS